MSLINLLPDDYLERRQRRRTNTLCLILFGILMMGVIIASLVSHANASRMSAAMDYLNITYTGTAETISQMQKLEAYQRAIQKKRESILSLLDLAPKSLTLAVITNARPRGVSLENIKLDTKFPSPEPAATTGKTKRSTVKAKKKSTKGTKPASGPVDRPKPVVTVEVIGLAHTDLQVARFLANLTRSRLMQSVDLVYTQDFVDDATSTKSNEPTTRYPLRKFRVNCRLRGGVDAGAVARRWQVAAGLAKGGDTPPRSLKVLAKPTPSRPGVEP